jgi:hypothetical protein
MGATIHEVPAQRRTIQGAPTRAAERQLLIAILCGKSCRQIGKAPRRIETAGRLAPFWEGRKVRGCAHTDQAPEFRNRLLATLSHEALSALRPHLEPMTAARGAVLCEAHESMWRVCFIESGVASLVTEYPVPVVAATVGREGAVGGHTLLLGGIAFGRYQMLARYQMLISGSALAVEAPRFRIALRENPKFHRLCESYTEAFFKQVVLNVACSRLHAAEQRCARWLLMCDDQVGDDTLELAQDSLAAMMGVPQMVADAVASRLQRAGLINLREAWITIPDRRKLEEASCVCYRTWHIHYERLLARTCA